MWPWGREGDLFSPSLAEVEAVTKENGVKKVLCLHCKVRWSVYFIFIFELSMAHVLATLATCEKCIYLFPNSPCYGT